MNRIKQQRIFHEWLEGYQALIFKVLRAYALKLEDQDDLFQEISLQLYRSIPMFRGESAISTWIYRIALNTAIKWSTKERKRSDSYKEVHEIARTLHSKEESDERIGWMYREVQQLNPIDRSLILLLLEGYSYQEMAKMMGISESNIGVKIHRIKKQLASKTENYVDYGI